MVDSPPLRIQVVSPAKASAALALAVRAWPAAEQAAQLQSLRAALVADGERHVFLSASREGRVIGAVLAHLAAGRTAGVYAPQLESGEDEGLARTLLLALDQELVRRGVHLAQSLLATDANVAASRLHAGGYRHLAQLLYLVSTSDQFPDHPPPLPFALERIEPHLSLRLQALLEATYVGTLDCPAVDGLRDPADVLDSYCDSATCGNPAWYIAHHAGRDVGCLLLGDHPQDDQLEIVYLGLTSEVRGQGWGIELARHAQWLARNDERQRLVLAVDANNDPAIAMYATCGFWVSDQRSAFVKSLRVANLPKAMSP